MLPLKNAGNIDVQLKLKVILTFTFLIRSGFWVSFCDISGSDCGTSSKDLLIFYFCFSCFLPNSCFFSFLFALFLTSNPFFPWFSLSYPMFYTPCLPLSISSPSLPPCCLPTILPTVSLMFHSYFCPLPVTFHSLSLFL